MATKKKIKRQPKVEFEEADAFFPHHFETRIKFEMRPRILISQQAYNDMYVIVDEVADEVGWLGLVEREGELFTIKEVFLVKQDVSAGGNILDKREIINLGREIMKRENGLEEVNKLRFWGHSHCEMECGPSPQDEDQIELFRKNECDFFIRGIANKRGCIRFDLFLFDKGIEITDIPWTPEIFADDKDRAKWKKEIKNKVKEHFTFPKGYTPPVRGGHLVSKPLEEEDSDLGSDFGEEGTHKVTAKDRIEGDDAP